MADGGCRVSCGMSRGEEEIRHRGAGGCWLAGTQRRWSLEGRVVDGSKGVVVGMWEG